MEAVDISDNEGLRAVLKGASVEGWSGGCTARLAATVVQVGPRQFHGAIARGTDVGRLGREEAVVDTLAIKCGRALQTTELDRLVVAGGVGANRRLRERLRDLADQRGGQVYYPRLEFCTDNGAMIAYAGWRRLAAGQRDDAAIEVLPRWPLDQLPAVSG